MEFILINEDLLERFNGFYKRENCRDVLYKMYKGVCMGCGTSLKMDSNYHVGHIIPRSKPEEFSELFQKLDVDNIINLNPLCSECNLGVSDNFSTYAIINKMFSYNYKKIKNNISLIFEKKGFVYFEPNLDKNYLDISLESLFKTGIKGVDAEIRKEIDNNLIIYFNDVESAIIENSYFPNKNNVNILNKVLTSIKATFKIEKVNNKFFIYQMYINPQNTTEQELEEILKIESYLNEYEKDGVDLLELKKFLTPLKIGKLIYTHLSDKNLNIYKFSIVSKVQEKKNISIFKFRTRNFVDEVISSYKNILGENNKFLNKTNSCYQTLLFLEKLVVDFINKSNHINLMENRRFSEFAIKDLISIDSESPENSYILGVSVFSIIDVKVVLEYVIKNNLIKNRLYLDLLNAYLESFNRLFLFINSYNISKKTFSEKKYREFYISLVNLRKTVENF